ncbi:MAG: class I SAM-dependent methyltransferase [Sulfuricellaceae bacterium]
MKHDADVLQQIATRTLGHYHARAAAFWEGTRHHDVEQNIEALLRHVQATPPFSLLDFGCGPGRDLRVFVQRGHRAIGLEGAPALAEMARSYSGCEVWQQNFLRMDLPDTHFDGVFANAALFHVPRQELPRVLQQLHASLRPGGVLFSSNPRGNNEERMDGERYGAYYDLATWRAYLSDAGFVELEHYYRPAGMPREQQPWLASVWRKRKSDRN